MNSVFAKHELEILSERDRILKNWDGAYPTQESKRFTTVIEGVVQNVAVASEEIVYKLATQGARTFHCLKTNRWAWDKTAKKLFILIKEKDGVFHLIRIDQHIKSGNYGSVYKVRSIFDKTDLALKVSVGGRDNLENADLERELHVYQQLYPQKPMGTHHTGIQMNCLQVLLKLPKFTWGPFRHVQLTLPLASTGKREKCLGFVMPLYPFETLTDKFNLSQFPIGSDEVFLKKKIECIYQILLGQARFESQKMAHLDLSPYNCFFATEDSASEIQMDLCDLGGVVDFSGAIRPFLIRRIFAYKDEFENIEKYQGDREKLIPLIIKNATFQSALMIYMFLSNKWCFPYSFVGIGDGRTGDQKSLPKSVGENLDWLLQVFDPDLKKRPTPRQALLNFHEYVLSLAKDGKIPPEYEKYNAEVQALCQISSNDIDEEKVPSDI